MKRIIFFIITNIAILLVLSIFLSLTGFTGILQSNGIDLNYESLMLFSLVFGMGGSFISLYMSKWMAKSMAGVKVLKNPSNEFEKWYFNVVEKQSKILDIKMPEIGIFQSQGPNAFATGSSKNSSLVALSTGLIQTMTRDEIEAVIGHEMSHVANGDMVTMALVQGVVNAFVMFFARIVTFAIDNFLRGDDEEGGGLGFFASMFVNMALQVVFGILAAPIVMGFSRWREYRADAGSAQLAGKEKMIAALEALKRNYNQLGEAEGSVKAMQISSKESFMELFSSHPPLEKRIQALKKLSR